MRPPAPGARFDIPTWVAVDELTPEEKVTNGLVEKQDETPATNDETGDTTMAAEDVKTGETANETDDTKMAADDVTKQSSQQQVEAVVSESVVVATTNENGDTVMEVFKSEAVKESKEAPVETSDGVAAKSSPSAAKASGAETTDAETEPMAEKTEATPLDLLVNTAMGAKGTEATFHEDIEMDSEELSKEGKPESSKESAASAAKTTALSPLQMSRETSESEGIPSEVARAFESVEGLEELRPHDPVADTLADPAAAPPSRPVSEPAAILMKGPAAPLFGDSVMSPVPAIGVPSKESPSAGPSTTSSPEESSSFVHSGSDSAPFRTPQKEGTSMETEPPSTGRGQPPLKKARLE